MQSNSRNNFSESQDKMLQQAIQAHQQGDLSIAANKYLQVLNENPSNADAWSLLGLVKLHQQDFINAIKHIKKAIQLKPAIANYTFNLALTYETIGNFEEAGELYLKASGLNEKDPNALIAFAKLKLKTNQIATAQVSIQKALANFPKQQEVIATAGYVYEMAQDTNRALSFYQQVLDANPNNQMALNNTAKLLTALGEYNTALQILNKLLELNPQHSSAWNNLGNILLKQDNAAEAILCFNKAISIEPDFTTAQLNLGAAYRLAKDYPAAKKTYTALLIKLTPDSKSELQKVYAGLAITNSHCCLWDETQKYVDLLTKLIIQEPLAAPIITPFEALMLPFEEQTHEIITKQFVYQETKKLKVIDDTVMACDYAHNNKIRVGYLSPDFSTHPIGLFISSCLRWHDATQYEVYSLSLQQHQDDIANKIKQSSIMIDLSQQSDHQAIRTIRDLKLDFLIDLAGYTLGSRAGLWMADYPNTIKMHWLGYPNSLCSEKMDYFIAHESLIPLQMKSKFKEKICYMNPSWIALDPDLKPKDTSPSREKFNLPEDKFIFGYLNRSYRIDKHTAETWANILHAVPNSLLWLNDYPYSTKQIYSFFQKNGIEDNRIITTAPKRLTSHWHQQLIDLWLDPIFFSSGTAALLCALANVPVLSFIGATPQARTSAAINQVLGMGALVTKSNDAYVKTAVKIAKSKTLLASIKTQLAQKVSISELFKPSTFMQHFEQKLKQLIQKKHIG